MSRVGAAWRPPSQADQIERARTERHGTLVYDKGDDLYARGLNMIMVFGKMSEGSHEGPEDIGELMVECNGPIIGAMGIEPMKLRVLEGEISVRPGS